MRDLNQIINELISNLILSESPLTNFTQQGVVYTLLRGFAMAIQQLEITIDRQLKNLDFKTASGSQLDSICSPFGVFRQQARQSTGWVLLISRSNILIPPGLTLTEFQSGNQYITTNSTNIEALAGVETVIPISSLGFGVNYDLKAGTKLYSSIVEAQSIVVGYERKFDGTACGNLQGGTLSESDNSLRQRWYAVMRAGGILTKGALRSLLVQHPAVIDAAVETTQPGLVNVLVRSTESTTTLKADLTNLVKNFVIDAAVKVTFVDAKPISLEIKVEPHAGSDLNQTKLNVRSIVEDYIISTRLTRRFDPKELQSRLIPEVKAAAIREPFAAFNWSQSTFVELGDLNVSFQI